MFRPIAINVPIGYLLRKARWKERPSATRDAKKCRICNRLHHLYSREADFGIDLWLPSLVTVSGYRGGSLQGKAIAE
ncbi:hypothetical protein [Novipirellula aureliae]|uniref:hypothetical protein n=1 Tax=Novipirellula aureliae TaxID=2527966 RepID=UPI0011B68343|nr:hypothetical protein [Novipirellula aureliae]